MATDKDEKYCDDCGALTTERDFTADSFEHCERWHCKLLKKDVHRYVDWNEHNNVAPKDCPLRPQVPKTPKAKLTENWKMKNLKLMKENKALRKDNNQLRKTIKRIYELSGSKSK